MSLLIIEWIVKRHLPISPHIADVVTLKSKQQRQDNKNTVTKIDNKPKIQAEYSFATLAVDYVYIYIYAHYIPSNLVYLQ